MSLLINDLICSYADRRVLDGISLSVADGNVVGLVGENGSGKSTLLRIAAGHREADGGSVHATGDVGLFSQDSGLDSSATLGQVLYDALAPLHRAVQRLESLAEQMSDDPVAAADYATVLDWAVQHDAWDADRRADVAAHRLGLGSIDRARTVGSMSGGERSRLALAALLTRRPGVLLLDEPTNHLDDQALDFVESELMSMTGATLVASHDRVFLDRTCTAIVDLDPSHFGTDGRGGRLFSGTFSDYLAAKQDSRARWQEEFEAQQDELNALRAAARTTNTDIAHNRGPRDNDKFIDAFKGQRVHATVSRRRRNAEQRIELLERERIPKPPAPMRFAGSFDREPIASVTLRDILVPRRLQCDRLDAARGEHLLVTGVNGAGKSTLLDVIAGRLTPRSGDVHVRARQIGLLTQDVALDDPSTSAAALFDKADSRVSLSALGLLHPRDHTRPIGALSLGQQRRVELALLIARQPDLLLLDEPTNHLSLALVDELEDALAASPVTVVLASHDRWIRRRWAGSVIHLQAADATTDR